MRTKFIVLTTLTVAITSVSVDPSHARRRGGASFFAPKPATAAVPATKPAPVAAAPRKDDVRTGGLIVAPGVAIRPSNGQAAADTPKGDTIPFGLSAPMVESTAVAAPATPAPTPVAATASTREAPPLPSAPVRTQLIDLNPTPPQLQAKAESRPQREVGPQARRQAVLCFKSADGTCSRFE